MFAVSKALFMGVLIGIFGVSLIPFTLDIEENLGLGLLFKLRGPRKAPADVVIITIDKASADILSLPAEPEKWPRALHARLTESLAEAGAAVIAFDIIFDEARSPDQDTLFADAIRNARNVVLCECLKRETVPLKNKQGAERGRMNIERLVPPIPSLMHSALALAPFPLPKVPVKVSQYWAIKAGAGDTPTLPVVAFQIFALKHYDEFIALLGKASPSHLNSLPPDRNKIIETRSVGNLVRTLKHTFKSHPDIPDKMLKELQYLDISTHDEPPNPILASLVKLYRGGNSRYLNFYGPPGTIQTIPFYKLVLPHEKSAEAESVANFEGKAVFIGLSEHLRPEQKDGFHTVFSQSSGRDISGVEIAATAFANLLEDLPIQPVGLAKRIFVVFLWGMLLGSICLIFPALIAALSVISLGTMYLFAAQFQFGHSGTWYPVVVPLLFETPLAFFAGVLWKYVETNKERQNIRKAFGYYLPNSVVDQLAKNISDLKSSGKIVYGVCLFTDAEQYTKVSEAMEPRRLHSFMNRYFEVIFEPVARHNGIVAEVFGDGMLAIWASPHADAAIRKRACHAALTIAIAVHQFNQSSDTLHLPTRMGLHSGYIFLGNVGAVDHYEYRPTGDIVNTASRIEGLNKYLGTRILVSEDLICKLDGFLTREIGKFVFVGKSKPILVYELLGHLEETAESQRRICAVFAEALNAYKRQSWSEAMDLFNESQRILGEDGPSKFYLALCEKHIQTPPMEPYDGVIHLTTK